MSLRAFQFACVDVPVSLSVCLAYVPVSLPSCLCLRPYDPSSTVSSAHAPALHVVLLQDPITGKPAVLVIVHNITQQKRMELQLAQRHEALQR